MRPVWPYLTPALTALYLGNQNPSKNHICAYMGLYARDFNPQSKMKAESIFGSPMQRQGLMNLGTPLHDKGHADDYEGHTHRKTRKAYKEGSYMDGTDKESSYPKLHTQNIGEIKRDKKVNLWFLISLKSLDLFLVRSAKLEQLRGMPPL